MDQKFDRSIHFCVKSRSDYSSLFNSSVIIEPRVYKKFKGANMCGIYIMCENI